MATEQGIITAVTYNKSHTVAKFRIGSKKWAYLRTANDVSDLLGICGIFSGEWRSTIKGQYFYIDSMEIENRPSQEKTMAKVLRFIAKQGLDVRPARLEFNQLLGQTLTVLFLMGRKQVIKKLLSMPEAKQDVYLANPYKLYLKKLLDYYSAETLSLITLCPRDIRDRILAHAHHAVTLFYDGGRESVTINEVAAELSNRLGRPARDIAAHLDDMTSSGGAAGLRRVFDSLMLDWIFALRRMSERIMRDKNPVLPPPDCVKDDECLSQLLSRRLTILSGGAGTGKTTLLKKLKSTGLRVIFSALTGKAATHFGGDGRTVHSLLGYRGGKFTVTDLDCDLLVVDEMSMGNWHTLYAILKAAPRVIFAGDPAQLPPVGGETVFHKMLAELPTVELTKSWRFKGNEGPRVQEIRYPGDRELLHGVRHMAASLSRIGSLQVITPVNTGLLGVGNLNNILRPVINREKSENLIGEFRKEDSVICCRNVYCDGILLAANGQVGTVVGREAGRLWVKINGSNILLEEAALRLAYATTVHKIQGAEFDHVIFVVPSNLDRDFLSDNLLLVGKTRGKEKTYMLMVDQPAPVPIIGAEPAPAAT